MVGFLRKKNKDAPIKPVLSGPIPLAASVSPPPPAVAPVAPLPPLFARFSSSSTSKSTNGTQATPRMVSSPMVLSSNARKDHHGHGQAEAVKKRSTQNQGPNKTLPSVTPPAPIVHKPLPPPTPPTSSSDPSGSPPSSLAIKQSRAPSAFQNQRILLDDVEETGPSSFHPFYSAQSSSTSLVSSPASRRSSHALTSPSKRNPPLSNTNLAPQVLPPIANRKMPEQQNPPAPAFGRHNLPTTAAQTQTPHLSQSSSVANQDLQPAIVNANMSMTGASSSQMGMQQIDTERSSVSDRNSLDIDLPPEFASLFHNFNQQFHLEDRNSVSSTRISNSNGHVPASNVPPSSITPPSSISISSPSRESLPSSRPRQPPLPEAPSAKSDMGVASSHAIGNGLLPSSMKDFYPPRVNGRASSFNNNNPAANQPQMLDRHHARPLPSPPPLNQDVSANFSPRSEVPSNNFQSSGSSPRKSTHSQNPSTVPMTGKPRIYAARSPPVDELDRESASFSKPPSQHVQSSAKKQPLQSTRHVQQPQQPQHQPSAKERSASMNGSDPFKPTPQPQSSPATPNSVERLPPTPPSQTRRSARLSRTGSKPDVNRPQSHHIPPTPIRKADEESRQSRHVPPMPGSHSRKGSNSDEQPRQVPRSSSQSRKDSRSDEQRPQSQHSRSTKSSKSDEQRLQSQHVPRSSPGSRSRKLSKPRRDVISPKEIILPSTPDSHHHRPSSVRTSTKSRPSSPVTIPHPPLPSPRPTPLEPAFQLDADTNSKAGIPLDDDPFSREEGMTLMKLSREEDKESVNESNEKKNLRDRKTSKESSQPSLDSRGSVKVGSVSAAVVEGVAPPTPISPEENKTKKKKKRRDHDNQSELTFVSVVADDSDSAVTAAEEPEPNQESDSEPEPEPIFPLYTIVDFVSDPQHLSSLLTFLSFYDWCVLSSLSKEIRKLLVETPELREPVLERFLMTVGYSRWRWDDPDPLSLSLQDLNDYMRGVSTPTHEYARVAGMYTHSLTMHPNDRDPALIDVVRILTMSTRAYTRVILRLRAQAEKEATLAQQSRGLGITIKQPNFNLGSSPARGAHSHVSSRAPSPTTSNYSYSHNGAVRQESLLNLTFRSPLFRLRRAPLLRVFVPSPEGDWLSDKSVLACEEECRRAGVMHLMRLGDVVWDVAVGDEGNVGRMVWDGSYLIDLDYTYTSVGDLPKYMPALAFPPSYFHRVIRTGPIISNPIVHIDISPWGEEIAMNLQLLQDRVRTETPQGAYHNVVRWVHRSSFVIRPGHARYTNPQGGGRPQMIVPRIPIPDTDNLFVDSGWHGTVVVETEGTNEALGDLQERCGPGAFPARFRARSVHPQISQIQIENKKVFRILREKSRPGEIWIKAVGIKERIM